MEKVGAYTDRVTGLSEWQGGDVQSGLRATPMKADYFNMLQRELVAVVQGAGIALNKDDDNQLLQAIRRIRGGAAANFGPWIWSASLAGNPGQGHVALNNVNPVLATELRISEASAEAEDFNQSLSMLRTGDTITFQDKAALLSYRFRVTNSGVDNGAYRSVPVRHVSGGGGLPAENTVVSVLITLASQSDDGLLSDPWALQPIGVPIPSFANVTGVPSPPTDKSYRYILLTAFNAYNSGVLTGEVVTGSAPLITATALVSLAGSPLNGSTVHLINTERRFLRAEAGYTRQDDALQNITGAFGGAEASVQTTGAFGNGVAFGTLTAGGTTRNIINFDASRVARTDVETRPRNVGVHYFMRVK